MTLKNAAAGLPHVGGKSVIFADPKMALDDEERLIRAFATAIGNLTEYIPGPDMGTDELAMGWIKDETRRAVGLAREIGSIPLDEIGATGLGIVSAIDVARRHIELSLAGARIVIQGFGSVGEHAARFLAEKGAVLIGASDTRGTIVDENGLDLAALIALKAEGRALHDYPRGRKLAADAVIDIPCEIRIPGGTAGCHSCRQRCAAEGKTPRRGCQYSLHDGGREGTRCPGCPRSARLHRQCGRRDLRCSRISRRNGGDGSGADRRKDSCQHGGHAGGGATHRRFAAHRGVIARYGPGAAGDAHAAME
jgi:hypothetical protein